jgi:hypothetical protein
MRKIFAILAPVTAALAAAVALAAPNVAQAANCTRTYSAGFYKPGTAGGLSDGQSATSTISMNGWTRNNGVMRSFIKLAGGSSTLQVGLINDNGTVQAYVESDGTFLYKAGRTKGNPYDVSIKKISGGNWEVKFGTQYDGFFTVNNATELDWSTTDQQSSGTCNVYSYTNTGMAPFTNSTNSIVPYPAGSDCPGAYVQTYTVNTYWSAGGGSC